MAHQGYNSRLDDSLGSRNGKKSQSMKSRRDESESILKLVLDVSECPVDKCVCKK